MKYSMTKLLAYHLQNLRFIIQSALDLDSSQKTRSMNLQRFKEKHNSHTKPSKMTRKARLPNSTILDTNPGRAILLNYKHNENHQSVAFPTRLSNNFFFFRDPCLTRVLWPLASPISHPGEKAKLFIQEEMDGIIWRLGRLMGGNSQTQAIQWISIYSY